MYQSNFKIICPHCDEEIDLLGDEFCNDSFFKEETTYEDCPFCGKEIEIKPEAIWSYEVKKPDFD